MKDKSNIAISIIWYERYLECTRTYGTEEFPLSVMRLYHSLLNLGKNKLAIRDICENYYKNEYKNTLNEAIKQECYNQEIEFDDPNKDSQIRQIKAMVIGEHSVYLFKFITQTIQDSGVGWHTEDELTKYSLMQE